MHSFLLIYCYFKLLYLFNIITILSNSWTNFLANLNRDFPFFELIIKLLKIWNLSNAKTYNPCALFHCNLCRSITTILGRKPTIQRVGELHQSLSISKVVNALLLWQYCEFLSLRALQSIIRWNVFVRKPP